VAGHSVLPQMFYSGGWHFVGTGGVDVLTDEKIVVTRGVTDDGDLQPAKITWTFNNQADLYRPSNPAGALYGLIQRNMPVAVAADISVRGAGEAQSFSPDQTPGFTAGPPVRGLRWVDMIGAGQLARIQSWAEPVRSPLYLQDTRYASLALLLPLEDARGATAPLNAAKGGGPAYATGVSFASGDGPGGAGTATAMTATSILGGTVLGMSNTAGWQLFFRCKLDTTPGATSLDEISWTGSNGYQWHWLVNNAAFNIMVLAGDGTVLINSPVLFGTGIVTTEWLTMRCKVSQSGGNVTVERAWYDETGNVFGTTDVFAGTVGRPTNVRVNGNATIDGALYNFIGVLAGVADNLASGDEITAFAGYVGELAGNRFTRLMAQTGIGSSIVGSAADTWPMGPQKPDTMFSLLKEIAATEDGLIYDRQGGLGVELRTRKSLTNQTAAITLNYANGVDIVAPLKERYDTADIANEITATQRGGGTVIAALTVGPLSNQSVPAGIGSKKGELDVNVSDEIAGLPIVAGWQLSRRTLDGSRYDTVVIDLDGAPGLIAAVNSIDVGDRIVIAGRDAEPIDLLVYSITDALETDRRIVTLTCSPAEVYKIGVYDAATSRYQAQHSTVGGTAPTTTATAWTVTAATLDDVWSTTATPYEWIVKPQGASGAGERVRVTAMAAATGTGPYTQTCTVVRSINGLVVTHAVGDSVQMAPRIDSTAGAVRYTM
jgi:hypothetical protein